MLALIHSLGQSRRHGGSQGWGRGTGNLGSRSCSKVADRVFLPHLPQLPSFYFYLSMCHILLALGLFFFFFF